MAPRTGQRSIGDFVKDTLEDFNDDGEINNSHLRPQRDVADIVKDALDDGEINNSNARNISDIVKDVLDDMGPTAPAAPTPKPQRRPEPFEPKQPQPAPAEEDVRSKIELFGTEHADAALDPSMGEDVGELTEYTDDGYGEYGGAAEDYDSAEEYDSSMETDTGSGYGSQDYGEYTDDGYGEYGAAAEDYEYGSDTEEYAADAF